MKTIRRKEAIKAMRLITKVVEQKILKIKAIQEKDGDNWTDLQELSVARFISSDLALPIESLWHTLFDEKAPWIESGLTDKWDGE